MNRSRNGAFRNRESREMSMSGNEAEGSAGPALAAHSKDASAPGPTSASAATAPRAMRTIPSSAASTGWAEYVRDNPSTALLWAAGIGILIGFLLRG